MTPEEKAALELLSRCIERSLAINKACEAAGIPLDGDTGGALLYMSAQLSHVAGGRREEWVGACEWLWEKLEQVAERSNP